MGPSNIGTSTNTPDPTLCARNKPIEFTTSKAGTACQMMVTPTVSHGTLLIGLRRAERHKWKGAVVGAVKQIQSARSVNLTQKIRCDIGQQSKKGPRQGHRPCQKPPKLGRSGQPFFGSAKSIRAVVKRHSPQHKVGMLQIQPQLVFWRPKPPTLIFPEIQAAVGKSRCQRVTRPMLHGPLHRRIRSVPILQVLRFFGPAVVI